MCHRLIDLIGVAAHIYMSRLVFWYKILIRLFSEENYITSCRKTLGLAQLRLSLDLHHVYVLLLALAVKFAYELRLR